MTNFNKDKYYVEGSDLLSEAEKLQMAKDLLELERRGILEYREAGWGLVAGVEIEVTPDGPVARFRKTDGALPGETSSSVTSSGEPSNAQGLPPVTKAARPSAEGASSPDSNNQDDDQ